MKSHRNCINFNVLFALNGKYIDINTTYASGGHNNDENIFNSLKNDRSLLASNELNVF